MFWCTSLIINQMRSCTVVLNNNKKAPHLLYVLMWEKNVFSLLRAVAAVTTSTSTEVTVNMICKCLILVLSINFAFNSVLAQLVYEADETNLNKQSKHVSFLTKFPRNFRVWRCQCRFFKTCQPVRCYFSVINCFLSFFYFCTNWSSWYGM